MKLFMLTAFLALVALTSVARADFVTCERFSGAACGDMPDADASACLAANAASEGTCGVSGTMTAGAGADGAADPQFWLQTRFWRQNGRLKMVWSGCTSITARVSVSTPSGATAAFIALHADNHLVAYARDGEPEASVSETFELSADGEVDLSLIGYRSVDGNDFATSVPSYGVAIKCNNQASFTSLLHAQAASHWLWVDASTPRVCTRADTSVVMNYAVAAGDAWQRTGPMIELSTEECVSPRAAIADGRLDAAVRATFTRPSGENWTPVPSSTNNEKIAARLLVAGRSLRFGSACVRVGAEALDTLRAEACTPSGASLTLVMRPVSGAAHIDFPVQSPVDDSTSPTPYPIERVYQTPGDGHYTTLLGVGPNGGGADQYHGHCVRMVASPWTFAANGLNRGSPQHWGARTVIGSQKTLSYAGAEPAVHDTLLNTEYVQIAAGGTSADVYVCPLAEQAQVLLHKTVTVCDSAQDCVCKTTGDPHHFSYDGLKEDYMAVGYHRITGAGSRFELNTFQDSMTTEGRVSFNRLLYLKVDGEDVFSSQVHREHHDWCLTFWGGVQKTGDTSATATDAQGFLTEAAGVDGLAMMPADGAAPWTHTTSAGNTVTLKALVRSDAPFGAVAHAGWGVDVPAYGLSLAFKFNTWRSNPHWDVYIHIDRAHANSFAGDLGGFCGNCNCDSTDDFTFKSSPDDIPPEYQCKKDCRRSDDDTPTGPPPPPTPLCEGEPISMEATIHDFARCHPDFQNKIGTQKNLVNFELEAWVEDRPELYFPVPALKSNGQVLGVSKGHYRSIESYKSWWGWHQQHDAAVAASGSVSANLNSWFGSTNPQCYDGIDHVVQLAGSKKADNVCCFEHGAWFPMDQFGVAPSPDTYGYESQSHNFWFTMEVRNVFTYTGDETFKFCGDDDVYVFINKRLFVDLGGVHAQQCTGWQSLSDSAATLGLELGGTYSFDFFFAERHTTQSNFKLTTSCFLEQRQTPQCDRMTDEAAHECCKHLIAPSDATAEADRTLNVPYKRCVIETKASCECNTQQQCEDEFLENLFSGRVPTPCPTGTATQVRAFMGTELALLGGWHCAENGGVSIPDGWAIARDSKALRAALPSRCDMGDKCLAMSSAFAAAGKGHSVSFDARGRDCDSSHAIIEDGDCYEVTPQCFRPRSCDAELLLVRKNSDVAMAHINAALPYAPDWSASTGGHASTQALEAHDSPTFAAHLAVDVPAGNAYVSHSVDVTAAHAASRMSCSVWLRQDPAALELAAGSSDDHVLDPTADAKAGGLYVVSSFHADGEVNANSLHYGVTARRQWLLATVDVPVPSVGAAGSLSIAVVADNTKIKHQLVAMNCSATPRFFSPNYVQGSTTLSHNRVRNPSFDADETATTWLQFEQDGLMSGASAALDASNLVAIDSSATAFGAMGMQLDDGTAHARIDATSASSTKVVGVQQTIQFADGNVDGGSDVYTVRIELDTKTEAFHGLCDLDVANGPTGIPRDLAEQAAVVYMDVHFAPYPSTNAKSRYGETLSLSVCDSSRWTRQSLRWSSPHGTSESIKWVTFTVMLRNSWPETHAVPDYSLLVDNVYVVGTDCDDTPSVPGVTSGDPHTLTMDGYMYDFHAPGDFLLLSDKFLTVYARHELPFSGVGSINTAVHMRFVPPTGTAGHLVEVYAHEAGGDNEPRLFVDGVLQPSLGGSSTHTTMRFGNGALVIDIDGSMRGDDPTRAMRRFSVAFGAHACTVVVSKSQSGVQLIDIVPQLPSSSATRVHGLLGNYDADAENDIRVLGASTPLAELCNAAERADGEETMRREAIDASEIRYVSNCPFHTSSTFRPPQAALLRSGFAASYNVTGHANVFPSASHPVDASAVPSEASFDDAALLARCNDKCAEHKYVTFDQFRNCVADCVMTGGDLLPRRMTVGGTSPTAGFSAESWHYWTHVRTSIGSDDSSSSATLTIVIVSIVAVVVVFIAVLAFVLLRRSRAATKLPTLAHAPPESHPLSPRDVESAEARGYTSDEKSDSI